MKFERSNLEDQEGEQNPEIVHELNEVDEKAGRVAEQLEEVDFERITPNEKQQCLRKLEIVTGALIAIIGAAATYEALSVDPAQLNDIGKNVGLMAGVFGSVGALYGLQKFMSAARKFRGVFTKEELAEDREFIGRLDG